MICIFHDLGEVRQLGSNAAVHFNANGDTEIIRVVADLMKGGSDLPQRASRSPPFATPLGRTLTPGAPTSCASRTYSFVSSMFFRKTAASAAWYSNALPSPQVAPPNLRIACAPPRVLASRG